jgi:chromosome segregation ATPase
MPTRYDSNPAEAEAALRQASDEVGRLDDEIAVLEEELEQVEDNPPEDPGEGPAWTARVGELDRKISDLQSDLRGAQEYLGNTQDYWFEDEDEDEDD